MASVHRCSPPPTLAPPSGDEPLRFHLLDSSSPSFGARGPSRCGGGGRSSDAAAAASRLLNGGDGGGSRGTLLREQPVPSLDPQGEARPGGEGQHMEAYAEQEAKKMATVLDGFSSCGSITTPFPCVSRVSPETSPARFDADTDPEKEPEASVGWSAQMLIAMGGRGAPYGRHPASSYSCCAAWSAASLTAHRAACPSPICRPVSSKGNDGCRDGGERRDDGHTSSFVTSQQEQELATDAVNGWRLPKVSEEEDEAVDQKDWQDDTLSSRVSSARGWNFESNSAYEGSNHDDGCAFDRSKVEDCAAAVQRMERRLRGPAMKQKDAQIEKLIDKLNQKEAQIDQWQKNKIAHARDKMTKSRSWRRRELKP